MELKWAINSLIHDDDDDDDLKYFTIIGISKVKSKCVSCSTAITETPCHLLYLLECNMHSFS